MAEKQIVNRDCGAFELSRTDDYPDFAAKVARSIKAGDLGILVCGSGHGMVIAANKISGARAILALSPASVMAGRRDDHANILVLAAQLVNFERAKKLASAFLSARPGKDGRYLRRLRKIKILER